VETIIHFFQYSLNVVLSETLAKQVNISQINIICFVSWKSTFDNSLSWDVDVKENVKDFVEEKYITIIIVSVLSPSPKSVSLF